MSTPRYTSVTSSRRLTGGLPYARLRMSDIVVVGHGVGHVGGPPARGEGAKR